MRMFNPLRKAVITALTMDGYEQEDAERQVANANIFCVKEDLYSVAYDNGKADMFLYSHETGGCFTDPDCYYSHEPVEVNDE